MANPIEIRERESLYIWQLVVVSSPITHTNKQRERERERERERAYASITTFIKRLES